MKFNINLGIIFLIIIIIILKRIPDNFYNNKNNF